MQSKMKAADLEFLLALTRGRTLATAADELNIDPSTVFRALKKLEKHLGERLFDRTRNGYIPTDLGRRLITHAESIETVLHEANSVLAQDSNQPTGKIRITTADAILQAVVFPILEEFVATYPGIDLELVVSNSLANLSHREADIAIRGTNAPPESLVGQQIGTLESGVFISEKLLSSNAQGFDWADLNWIAVDDSLSNYASSKWLQENHPRAKVRLRCNSVVSVAHAIAHGMGVGVSLMVLMNSYDQVRLIQGPIPDLDTGLWVLTHPEVRYLHRVRLLFDFLKTHIVIPGSSLLTFAQVELTPH